MDKSKVTEVWFKILDSQFKIEYALKQYSTKDVSYYKLYQS